MNDSSTGEAPAAPVEDVLPVAAPAPGPAGFWRRAAALGIDWIAVLVARVCFRMAARALWGGATDSSPVLLAAFDAFKVVFAAAYVVFFHWLWGQTFGKMALSIRVVRVSGGPLSLRRSIGRGLAFLVSVATLGLGFAVALVRADRRALHDLIAGTRVERVP
jgi:uncharacterized RDD family membrane protein YckC